MDYVEDASRYVNRPVGGTDVLVFRELQRRIESLKLTGAAIDVGCGAGRSTRFLQMLGFQVVGLDVSEAMINQACQLDSQQAYCLYERDAPFPFADELFDVLLSTWAVLEIDSFASLQHFMKESARVLRPNARGFIVTNTAEFYAHRWVSCEVDFPHNQPPLRSGQNVRARLIPEGVIVEDTFWQDQDYRNAMAEMGICISEVHFPLAPSQEEGWLDETKVAPYVIYEIVKSQ